MVDDGSTDDTLAVLAGFDAPNLRVLCPPDHAGMVGNFNRSVHATRGRWVTVLGADDELVPAYYENLAPHLDRDDVCAMSQVAWIQWQDREEAFGPTEPHTFTMDEFLPSLGHAMCISTTAFRRDLFDAVGGFDAAVGSLFDFDLFFRLARSSGRALHTLGVEGGRYYPLRGSTWNRHEAAGEAAELLLAWIRLRSADIPPATRDLVATALAERAHEQGGAELTAGNREGARRNFAVAAACSQGRTRAVRGDACGRGSATGRVEHRARGLQPGEAHRREGPRRDHR